MTPHQICLQIQGSVRRRNTRFKNDVALITNTVEAKNSVVRAYLVVQLIYKAHHRFAGMALGLRMATHVYSLSLWRCAKLKNSLKEKIPESQMVGRMPFPEETLIT